MFAFGTKKDVCTYNEYINRFIWAKNGPLICVYCIFGLKSNTLLYYNMKLRDKLKYFNLSLIKTAIYRSGKLDRIIKAKNMHAIQLDSITIISILLCSK